ncbi:MAG: polysaccharide biosynthesis/export family protein [Deltaproteobacteria bacterium]|nr:polysaccharide biosynthesis/export family protein [Deltaproteobacteria bacterium]
MSERLPCRSHSFVRFPGQGRSRASGEKPRLLTLLRLALVFILALPCCYSSTAVKGTPVNELGHEVDRKRLDSAEREKTREALAEMSGVSSNRVFTEIDGVPEYRIGPLDILEISSYIGDKVETVAVPVNSRGKISYSFIDDAMVAGLTPSQVDELLTEKLSSYVRKPRINVLVKEFRSKNAMVMGELASLRASTVAQAASGRVALKGKTTLMDLISSAGGYTVDADIKNVKLIREGRTFLINLYDIIEKGDTAQDVIIDDGDVLNIPELPEYGERVYVMGEVNAQGVYSLKDAQDLLAAISLAGSFTSVAKEENTLIVRGYERGNKPLVMMADLNALLRKADLSQNISLEDGDLVYVPRMLIGDINEWVSNTTPLLDFLFYPADLESRYFIRRYLHLDRHHHK